MKRWIATILSISLVIGMAAVLHACGKPKDAPETTTEPATGSAADGETSKSFMDEIWGDLDDLTDEYESYSHVEYTTNEHYQEEYDALTLPRAVTTQPVAGTTKAQTTTNPAVRETTTAFQFTSPSGRTTTKAAQTTKPSGDTTQPSGGTTKPATTAASGAAEPETTTLPDLVGNNAIPAVQEAVTMPRPQVTYLDRYVIDILESGSYTAVMQMNMDGTMMQATTYVDGDDFASEIPVGSMMMQEMGIPASVGVGNIRMILKDMDSNPKAYVALPSGYLELEDLQEAGEMLKEAGGIQNLRNQMQIDRLQYAGKTTGVGFVCESYIVPEENTRYNFYFAQTPEGYTGLIRWDIIDTETKETLEEVNLRLTTGVKNQKVFTVSGKKLDPAELEKMFAG